MLCSLILAIYTEEGSLTVISTFHNVHFKSNSIIRVKYWCIVLSMERVTLYGHPPECRGTFGEGGFILFDKIPVPTIELSLIRFHTFRDISLSKKLTGKSHCPQNKTVIRRAVPVVSDEL